MGTRNGNAAAGGRVRLPLHADHLLRDVPFPHPIDAQRDAIAEAARDLDRLRTGWLTPPGLSAADLSKRTLTNLYNARPTWLAQAHERLDAAVLAAYGWPTDIDRGDLLGRLLALNLARAAGEASGD